MSQKKISKNSKQLQSTLLNLQKALDKWQELTVDPTAVAADEYTKKTRELLRKLNAQIKSLDL